jgi:hypothetical protein
MFVLIVSFKDVKLGRCHECNYRNICWVLRVSFLHWTAHINQNAYDTTNQRSSFFLYAIVFGPLMSTYSEIIEKNFLHFNPPL